MMHQCHTYTMRVMNACRDEAIGLHWRLRRLQLITDAIRGKGADMAAQM